MKIIPQPLDLLLSIRTELRMGSSLGHAIERVSENSEDPLLRALKTWLIRIQSGQDPQVVARQLHEINRSSARRSLFCVFEKGLSGSPVDGALEELEEEFFLLAQQSYERKLQTLPMLLLLPLTLLILPATMILILGPVLFQLVYTI